MTTGTFCEYMIEFYENYELYAIDFILTEHEWHIGEIVLHPSMLLVPIVSLLPLNLVWIVENCC